MRIIRGIAVNNPHAPDGSISHVGAYWLTPTWGEGLESIFHTRMNKLCGDNFPTTHSGLDAHVQGPLFSLALLQDALFVRGDRGAGDINKSFQSVFASDPCPISIALGS